MGNDGYPTDEEHERLVTFEGTPREFCEYVASIYQNGFTSVELIDSEFWGRVYEFRTVTGGWSGCEHTDGVIQRGTRADEQWDPTFFRLRFWESDHRGGLTVYHIKEKDWESEGFWGSLSRWPGGK